MSIEMASFLRAVLFLGVPFVVMIFVLQYKWAKTCEHNIRVLVAQASGGGAWELAPKQGGEVTITNPETGESRTWAVNELATIDIPYPGVGFVPGWMQKTIRLAVVNEGDWEPLLNRSPHRKKIASPDVVEYMRAIADTIEPTSQEAADEIRNFLGDLSTGPTREMVADPSNLGNLMRSGVLKALATVSNDLMEQLKSINNRLSKFITINPVIVYILLGIMFVATCFLTYQVMQVGPALENLKEIGNIPSDIAKIKAALGITG